MSALRAKLDGQDARVASLDSDLNRLRAVIMQDKRIDLVRMGPFLTFMFREDMAYAALPDILKEQTLFDLEGHAVPNPPADINGFLSDWRLGEGDILELMVGAFGARHGPSDFVDVGCQYGSLSMHIADFIGRHGLEMGVYAFDCGVTRQLAAYNFINNGLGERVRFFPYAVGAAEGYTLVHRDVGHSEGNRIGGYISSWERGSTDEVVRCVSLDSLVTRGQLDRPVVLKVDTEGAEPAVLRGAGRLIGGRPCALQLEFTPSGFGAAVGEQSPVSYLRHLMADFHLFDIGREHSGARLIAGEGIEDFIREIAEHPAGWTDLVALDRRSEVCAWLFGKLASEVRPDPV